MTPSLRERRAQEVFRSLLLATSYPGRPYPLPTRSLRSALQAIAECLVDQRVGVWGPGWLLEALREQNPRAVPIPEADFVFLEGPEPLLQEGEAPPLKRGSPIAPETGATLVLGARFIAGTQVRLRGPGIPGEALFRSSLPAEFWAMRNRAVGYPLGFEVVLTDGLSVVAVPRGVEVEPWDT